MNTAARTVVAVAVLTVSAAGLGFWAGSAHRPAHHAHSGSLDEILHQSLGLTPAQEKQIAVLEAKFALDRKDLEAQMQAANRDLARALGNEHDFGDPAKRAVGRFHVAMAALQEQTIMHVLAMRAVLTPDQAERFDQTVLEALAPERP